MLCFSQAPKEVSSLLDAINAREYVLQQCASNQNNGFCTKIKEQLEGYRLPTLVIPGPSGSGKSTLINALCGNLILPAGEHSDAVTSAAIKICSSAIENYEVEIDFISKDEWERKKAESTIILNGGRRSDKNTENKRAMRDARLLFETIYGSTTNIDTSVDDELPFGTKCTVECSNREDLNYCIAQYSSNKSFWNHNLQVREREEPEIFYWPIVSQITIKGNFTNIPHGISILDLPGYESNSNIRLEIIDANLSRATRVWFAARMARFNTDTHLQVQIRRKFANHSDDKKTRLLITQVQRIREFNVQKIADDIGLNAFDRILPINFKLGEESDEIPLPTTSAENNFHILKEDLQEMENEYITNINNVLQEIAEDSIKHPQPDAILACSIESVPLFFVEYPDLPDDNRALGWVYRNGGRTRKLYVAEDVWYELLKYIGDNWKTLVSVFKEFPYPIHSFLNEVEQEFTRKLHKNFCNLLYANDNYPRHQEVRNAATATCYYCVNEFPAFWNSKLLEICQSDE